MHVRRVRPGPDDGVQRRGRTQPSEQADERNGLVARIDDAIRPAPPQLQRNARRCDCACVRQRTARRIGTGIGARRAADLGARELPQAVADRRPPPRQTASVAADAREVAIAPRQVRDRVERRRTGEQRGMACHQQQALLAAHARAEGVGARPVEPEPRNRAPDDLRHAREIVDLPGIPPREPGEPPSLPLGIHDGERSERRQVAPALHVLARRDAATVRRDDQRQRRIVVRAVPGRENEVRDALPTAVRLVVERETSDGALAAASHLARRSRGRNARVRDGGDQ